MITLDPQLEQQLNTLAYENGLTTAELIKRLFLDYKLDQDALKSAEISYADYKKTGRAISLGQLINDQNLDS